jgi:DNA-binding NarL/FixJ family response regulator
MAPPVPIILAFKHPIVTIGVRTVLALHDDIQILAECSTLAGTVRALKKYRPRVIVAGTGICHGQPTAVEMLAHASPETRLALFCTHPGNLPEHALLQGASAVLPPEAGPEHLVDCIHTLAEGRRWRAPAKLRQHADKIDRRLRRPAAVTVLAALSVRERQIAQAVATGKRNKEIAEAYGISPGTVKLHLNRVYAKLGVNSRLALFRKLVSEANLEI